MTTLEKEPLLGGDPEPSSVQIDQGYDAQIESFPVPPNETGRRLEEISEQWLVICIGKMAMELDYPLEIRTPDKDEVGVTTLVFSHSDDVDEFDSLLIDFMAEDNPPLLLKEANDDPRSLEYELWTPEAWEAMESVDGEHSSDELIARALPIKSKDIGQEDKKTKYDLAGYIARRKKEKEEQGKKEQLRLAS